MTSCIKGTRFKYLPPPSAASTTQNDNLAHHQDTGDKGDKGDKGSANGFTESPWKSHARAADACAAASHGGVGNLATFKTQAEADFVAAWLDKVSRK